MSARRFTPVVSRRARIAIAGGVWTAVGIMLLAWAAGWLAQVPLVWAIAVGLAGVGIGVFAWQVLFARLVSDNLARLAARPASACAFGFIAPKGWAITASMILLGAALRHSALPKPWLAAPYAAIGTALFLASLAYYPHLARLSKGPTT
jgi:hypothetical protein